jgi:hypothetical protein
MDRHRTLCWVLFALLWGSYAYVHQRDYRAATPVSRLDLLHALFTHRTFCIDAYNNTGDRALYNGRYYSDKAPGGAAVALPGFALATVLWRLGGGDIESEAGWLFTSWVATACSMGLLTALGGVCLFRLLCRWSSARAALVTTLGIFLGAAPFPYATQMFTHGMVVGLIALMLWWLRVAPGEAPEVPQRHLVLAGLAAGLALASEFTAGLVLYALGLLVLDRDLKPALRFAWAAVLPLCLVPLYSWICFENPFVIGYSHQASYDPMREGLYGIREPSFKTMLELTVGPCRGLFFWSPFLLLALAGYGRVHPLNRKVFWLVFWTPLLQLVALSGYFDWKAGPTLGPRYLAPALPLLAIPAALAVQAYPRVGTGLGALSIVLTGGATLITAAPDYDPNPLLTQHLPRLWRGEFSYTLGEMAGLPPTLSVWLLVLLWVGAGLWLWRQTVTEQGASSRAG